MPPVQPLQWASGSELNRAQDAKRVVTLMLLDLVACETGDAFLSLLVKQRRLSIPREYIYRSGIISSL
jgi:hypothetical protein